MENRKVYLVSLSGLTLTVNVAGQQVPMDEFLQTHTPVQVTNLTQLNVPKTLDAVGLMIADESPTEATWGVSHGS